MNLQEFEFPRLSQVDIVFPTIRTNQDLLEEAYKRGFANGNTPYNKMFNTLFFHGGKVKFKKNLDESFLYMAYNYFRALMGSFEPKHEDKEAVCAMILSEIVEPELDKS